MWLYRIRRTRIARLIPGWFAVAVALLVVPTLVVARFLPEELLHEVSQQARWGAPLWFGLVAGAAGLVRGRVQEYMEEVVQTDGSAEYRKRMEIATELHRALDGAVVLGVLLAVAAFFVPPVADYGWGAHWAMLLAASPFGSAFSVLWMFFMLGYWRRRIDEMTLSRMRERKRQEKSASERKRLESGCKEEKLSPLPRVYEPPRVSSSQSPKTG